MTRITLFLMSCLLAWTTFPSYSLAKEQPSHADILEERMAYYLKYEALTLVPWYYLAAVDQFERNIQQVRKDIPKRESTISIQFAPDYWAGNLNPNQEDNAPESIAYFGGHGLDGNGDGLADRLDDEDVLYTMSLYLQRYGYTEDDFKIALWEYYGREKSVNQIVTIAQLFKHFQRIDLAERVFPLPLHANYSYRSTWGDGRGWGGRRIHEGTDIFAGYGVPVRATTYGIIEVMGWNNYGGWRVGIRDHLNNYHYFAHLAGFNKELKEGDIVEPGTVIGYVGSSGYGKPGTSGKFPPHLHYGIYKDNGRTEWAYDPFPSLVQWERMERQSKKKKK